MATSLTLRSVKGSQLTIAEVDANFTALRTTADGAVTSAAAAQTTANNAVTAAAAAQTTANSASTAAATAQNSADAAAAAAASAAASVLPSAAGVGEVMVLYGNFVGTLAAGSSIAGSSLLKHTANHFVLGAPYAGAHVLGRDSSPGDNTYGTTGYTAMTGTWRALGAFNGRFTYTSGFGQNSVTHYAFAAGLYIRIA